MTTDFTEPYKPNEPRGQKKPKEPSFKPSISSGPGQVKGGRALRMLVVIGTSVCSLAVAAGYLLMPSGGSYLGDQAIALGGPFSGHGRFISYYTASLFNSPGLISNPNSVTALTFHPKQDRLYSTAKEEIIAWSLAGSGSIVLEKKLTELGLSKYESIKRLYYPSVSSGLFAVTSRGKILKLNPNTFKVLKKFERKNEDVLDLKLVQGSLKAVYKKVKALKLVDVNTGAEEFSFKSYHTIRGARVDSLGRYVAVARGKKIVIYEIATGEKLREITNVRRFRNMEFEPERDQLVYVADRKLRSEDVVSGEYRGRINIMVGGSEIQFTSHGKELLTGGGFRGKRARLYDLVQGEISQSYQEHQTSVYHVALSNKKKVATGTYGGLVWVQPLIRKGGLVRVPRARTKETKSSDATLPTDVQDAPDAPKTSDSSEDKKVPETKDDPGNSWGD